MRRFITSTVFMVFAAAPEWAEDTPVCMPAVELEATLKDWYGETPVTAAQDDQVLWASERNDTWTLVEYRSYEDARVACTLASGEDRIPASVDQAMLALPADTSERRVAQISEDF